MSPTKAEEHAPTTEALGFPGTGLSSPPSSCPLHPAWRGEQGHHVPLADAEARPTEAKRLAQGHTAESGRAQKPSLGHSLEHLEPAATLPAVYKGQRSSCTTDPGGNWGGGSPLHPAHLSLGHRAALPPKREETQRC